MPATKMAPNQEWIKIGNRIAELREGAGLTQRQLAERLSTSQSAVARMERGDQNMSAEMLTKLSRALGRDIITLGGGSANFRIEGGHKLSGSIEVKSSKNAAVAILAASLLNQGKTTLRRMPRIEEVNRLVEVLVSIGVGVRWRENNDLEITPPRQLDLDSLNAEAGRKTRSIIMFLGPLMHYFKEFQLPYAGGCKLGARSVRPHLYALEEFGLKVKTRNELYHCTSKPRKPGTLVMYENGNTPTENAIMAAALTPGVTEIRRAASNYMVIDLCYFLEKLGVQIEGIGTHRLRIHGVKSIRKDVEYWPSEDPIEAMTFLSLAATTDSPIEIKRLPIDYLELELLKLKKMGFKFKLSKTYKAANGKTNLVDVKCLDASRLVALEDKLEAHDDPGMNMDSLPYFVPVAASAKGNTLIHDWAYENRAIYFTELTKLNAQITLIDIHRVQVVPTHWRAAEVICPPALRPAVIILIAMLAADGKSVLRNVYSINRGYEDLATRLRGLGAHIETLHEF